MTDFTDDIRRDKLGNPVGYYGFAVGEDGLPSTDPRQEHFRQQRDTLGFDATETWSLFASTLMFMIPRLRYFSEHLIGHPHGLTSEQWKDKLEKFTANCEVAVNDSASFADQDKAKQECMKFMKKYFFHLWD